MDLDGIDGVLASAAAAGAAEAFVGRGRRSAGEDEDRSRQASTSFTCASCGQHDESDIETTLARRDLSDRDLDVDAEDRVGCVCESIPFVS